MFSSKPLNYNHSTFASATQQKKSQGIVSFLLPAAIVIIIHGVLVWYVSRTPEVAPTDNVIMIEVAMIQKSGSSAKASAIPSAVKKEPVKPKPAAQPKLIKKSVAIKKPAPKAPELKETLSAPQFTPTTPPVASASAPAASTPTATANTTSKVSKDAAPGSASNQTVISSVIPLFRTPPKYPNYAASRHIEGWVKVEFTVKTDGSVENAVVVSSEPEDIFDDAALTAINQWKFKEKIVNGVSVTQRAVQKLQFKLEQ